ncbi:alpha/beta fold hydrolase [Haloplanus aerogenes]|uniref:Alpha/beta hydrolase n=1 Tax=Haloplanus aerogenes TaxID=660522 RepID=A0A3M0D4H1_9EURY|nr:alpha/beta hydrolase [Haloplanus aerogenes]AZH24912.1 alpha/beta hydrolase [Haloplanus aerogenes]RMB13876.1 pimeloyl-ACP methyl ester carboxylesterase [Haloplanus aerogenes]
MDAAHPPSTESVDCVPIDDDRHVAYAEYGDPTGRPVLFLHGTPGSHRLGRLFDDTARREGVRLLAIDRPGYGRSSPWPTRDLTDTGAFVVPVLDDVGVDRAGVVGFSGGGPHALALAATHGARVERVDVVSGATPPSVGETPTTQRLLETLASTAPSLLRGLFRGQATLAEFFPPAVVVSQYTTAEGRASLSDDVAALVARDFVEAFAQTRRGAVTELRLLSAPWPFSLSTLDVSVNLWHGANDTNVPVEGVRRFCDRLPDAQLTVFEDADHLTTLLRSRSSVVADVG